jgi:hypothetical protein
MKPIRKTRGWSAEIAEKARRLGRPDIKVAAAAPTRKRRLDLVLRISFPRGRRDA